MLLPRPSLAFAGSAAVLVVAGIVSHEVLLPPRSSPSEVAPLSSDGRASSYSKGIGVPTPRRTEVEPAVVAKGLTLPEASRLAESGPAPSAPADAAAPAPPAADELGRRQALAEARSRAESSSEAFAKSLQGSPIASISKSLESPSRLDARESSGRYRAAQSHDRFTRFTPNPVKVAAEEPVSTFSIDVDTASYAFLRASLNEGYLPGRDAVRTEELVNYFPYDYAPPEAPDAPFATHVSVTPAPWNDAARLMHIGIKGYALDRATAPRANLVFLIDTSGSMDEPNKLPLLIRSLTLLLTALAPEDRVAIVAYAGSAGVVLASTPVAERATILASLERLHAGGSTAGEEGIREAYRLAGQHFVAGGVNRVILATDGDFNVGITDPDALEDYIARKRASGVSLSVLGFGMGNYNDELMQRLAQNGNGNAAYIDSLSEARKVLLEEAASTLVTIAKDVKVQVEFNPAAVSEYRLIGYETRTLTREEFRNDKVDAGEIGAGHTVTAIYELIPAGIGGERIPALRYQGAEAEPSAGFDGELAFLKIRYKLPDAESSTLITRPVTAADAFDTMDAAPRDVRFAAAVAAFGELLRGARYTGDYGYGDVIALAQGARGDDPFGYRNEFVRLVHLADSIAAMYRGHPKGSDGEGAGGFKEH